MKNFKRVFVCFLALALLVPLFAVQTFAQETSDSISEHWNTMSAKYSSSNFKMVLTQGVVKTEGFKFTENSDGGIDVHMPPYSEFGGGCSTVVVSNKAHKLRYLDIRTLYFGKILDVKRPSPVHVSAHGTSP